MIFQNYAGFRKGRQAPRGNLWRVGYSSSKAIVPPADRSVSEDTCASQASATDPISMFESRTMSFQHGDRARYYRNKAEELRTMASDMADADSRRTIERLARNYDVMTQRAEQRIGESPDRKTSKPE